MDHHSQTQCSLFNNVTSKIAVIKHHIQFILLGFDAWSDFVFEMPKNVLFRGAVSHSFRKVKQRIELGRSFRDFLIGQSVSGG